MKARLSEKDKRRLRLMQREKDKTRKSREEQRRKNYFK